MRKRDNARCDLRVKCFKKIAGVLLFCPSFCVCLSQSLRPDSVTLVHSLTPSLNLSHCLTLWLSGSHFFTLLLFHALSVSISFTLIFSLSYSFTFSCFHCSLSHSSRSQFRTLSPSHALAVWFSCSHICSLSLFHLTLFLSHTLILSYHKHFRCGLLQARFWLQANIYVSIFAGIGFHAIFKLFSHFISSLRSAALVFAVVLSIFQISRNFPKKWPFQ